MTPPKTEIMAFNSTHARILGIPQEIRDMIYDHVLIAKSPILIWGHTCRAGGVAIPGAGLLRACKQIHIEAEQFLYKTNTFILRFDFRAKLAPLYALRGVVPIYPIDAELERDGLVYWRPVRGIQVLVEREHFPVQKIQKLRLQLIGPQDCELDPAMGAFGAVKDEGMQLTRHINYYLKSCINNCTSLKRLYVDLYGWNRRYKQSFCINVLLANMSGIHCIGQITVTVGRGFKKARDDEVEYFDETKFAYVLRGWREKSQTVWLG